MANGVGINADFNCLSLAAVRIECGDDVALCGDGIKEARVRSASSRAWIKDDARRRRREERGSCRCRSNRGGRANVHAIQSPERTGCATDLQTGHNGEAAPVGAAIGIDGDGNGILVDGNSARSKRTYGTGGQWREINGGNGIRTGVGDDREVGFLVNGHTAGTSADSHCDGFSGGIGHGNAIYEVKNGGGVRTAVGNHSDAGGSGSLAGIGEPGKNSDASGGVARGNRLEGLAENVGRVQAENGNLVAARAGVGNNREIVDLIDGDATRSGGCAPRRGSYVAGVQRNYLAAG